MDAPYAESNCRVHLLTHRRLVLHLQHITARKISRTPWLTRLDFFPLPLVECLADETAAYRSGALLELLTVPERRRVRLTQGIVGAHPWLRAVESVQRRGASPLEVGAAGGGGARGGGGESGAGAQAAQGAQRCRRRARGCLEGREPATQHCERTAERLRCVGRYLSIYYYEVKVDAQVQATMSTAQEDLSAMLAELRSRCPVLHPSVIPGEYDDSRDGAAMLSYCRDAPERQALAALLLQKRATKSSCELTGKEVESAEALRFVGLWDLIPRSSTIQLRRCVFASPTSAQLLDSRSLMERFARPCTPSERAELDDLAVSFCEANGHADRAAKPASALLWLQECLALAHACRVVAGTVPSWRLLGPEGEALEASLPAHSLVEQMLGGGRVKRRENGQSARTSESKRKKSTGRISSSPKPVSKKKGR